MTGRAAVTAIVLAGGRSSRFGGPKLTFELDGEALLHHALRAVAGVVSEIIVAGAPEVTSETHEAASDHTIRIVPDDEPFAGPLAALAGALRATATELAIVVGGDMPGLVPVVLTAMLRRLDSNTGFDAVLLASPASPATRRQVLPLALRVAAATGAAQAAFNAGDRSLMRLVDRLRSIEIPAPEWLALDPAGNTLLDVDWPADLERMRNKFR